MQYHNDHSSIGKIRENLNFTQSSKCFKFEEVTESDIFKRLNKVDGKKVTYIDKIVLKLIKKIAAILSKYLYDAISKRQLPGIFLDNADNVKVASVSPINKRSDDKNKISAYSPVSILRCFSEI